VTIMGEDAINQKDAGISKPSTTPGTPAPLASSPLPPAPRAPRASAPQNAPPAISPPLPTPQAGSPGDASMQSDMAKILGGVKLPERRGPLAPPPETPQKKYDTTLADPQSPAPHAPASPRGIPTPAVSPIPAPESPLETKPPSATSDDLRSLHTLKDDLQHVVQENKISYVRAVALEEDKRHRIDARTPVSARKNKRGILTFFIVGLLMGTGALALGAVYMVMQERSDQSNASLQSNILFAEQTVPFAIDNEAPADVRRTLASARDSNTLTLGAILQIIPMHTQADSSTGGVTETPITFGEFLTALGTRAPDELARALADGFFFGIHTVDENAPVIIVPVLSYERAFAAMLEWEPTMNADLEPLFSLLSTQAVGQNGLPVERVFEDTVMRNYDVRALKDDDGTIQLYYSFPTRNVLIIAESPFSFTEVLSRLRADRRL